jgi:hypothetical protein
MDYDEWERKKALEDGSSPFSNLYQQIKKTTDTMWQDTERYYSPSVDAAQPRRSFFPGDNVHRCGSCGSTFDKALGELHICPDCGGRIIE